MSLTCDPSKLARLRGGVTLGPEQDEPGADFTTVGRSSLRIISSFSITPPPEENVVKSERV